MWLGKEHLHARVWQCHFQSFTLKSKSPSLDPYDRLLKQMDHARNLRKSSSVLCITKFHFWYTSENSPLKFHFFHFFQLMTQCSESQCYDGWRSQRINFFFFWWHRRTSLRLVARRRAYCTTILTVNQTPTGNWPHPPEPVTR